MSGIASPVEDTVRDRFAFGENWRAFLSVLDEERIAEAERSLKDMLGVETLEGRTFLDAGSGSGLFSLAAMRLAAQQVHSFDYDRESVACTEFLKERYFPTSINWSIERGSVLDAKYLAQLGQWDVVYSWGVLHHTGAMWEALGNVTQLVAPEGMLFISIYNDQGLASHGWRLVKRLFNTSELTKRLVCLVFIPYFAVRSFIGDLLKGHNPVQGYREYKRSRGMSRVHDWLDWLGGYPFQVAKPEQIFDFYHQRGFTLERLTTRAGGLACNEFVFSRRPVASAG
jgi:2-polyprenyl-6-hydroxyphenyl methylase/3-demethylubiquinone-9 3-methyltransferase